MLDSGCGRVRSVFFFKFLNWEVKVLESDFVDSFLSQLVDRFDRTVFCKMSFLFAAIALTSFLLSKTIDLHRTETRRVSGRRRRSGTRSGSWGRTLLRGERTRTKVPLLLRTELSLSVAIRERESSLGLSLLLGSLLLRDLRTMVTSHAKQ